MTHALYLCFHIAAYSHDIRILYFAYKNFYIVEEKDY
jgi:hypothetical protein